MNVFICVSVNVRVYVFSAHVCVMYVCLYYYSTMSKVNSLFQLNFSALRCNSNLKGYM